MGKGKSYGRPNSLKPKNKRKRKIKKYKKSGWKLIKFPEIFEEIEDFPYIVRKDRNKEKKFKKMR